MEIVNQNLVDKFEHESYGISIVFVRKDNCENYGIDGADPVREIIEKYRENEIYLKENSGYFRVVELDVFGYFDKVYLFFNHTFKLSARHIHPASILLNEEYRFHSKIITGFISTYKNDDIPQLDQKGLPDSQRLFKYLETMMSDKNKGKHSFTLISRIKLNSSFLYELGGMYYSIVKGYLTAKFKEINEKDRGSIQCSYLFIESFGFSELILFTSWSDFKLATNSLFSLRDSVYSDVVLDSKDFKIPERKLKYINRLSSLRGRPLFDSWSTSVGPLSEDFFKLDDLHLLTKWSVKPGSYASFEKAIRKTNFSDKLIKVFGWEDSMTNNIYSHDFFNDSNERQEFLNEHVQHIDAVNTIVSLPTNLEPIQSEIVEFQKNERDTAIVNLYINFTKRRDIEYKLLEMGVSSVVITRVTNSIGNFNKSIKERENIPFFIFLEEYLQSILIKSIDGYYETFTNRLYLKEFNLRKLESTLISISKGFESAFSNRYMHSQELSESPDTNFSYKGGIQQYLIIYEHLFRNMFIDITGIPSPGVSLYVSGYSSTESTKHYMRLNIFQVYEPALFLVALAHEVAIHYFDLLITDMYTNLLERDLLCKIIDRNSDELKVYSTSDILFFLDRLGAYDKKDLFHNIVYKKYFSIDEFKKVDLSYFVPDKNKQPDEHSIVDYKFSNFRTLSETSKDILQYLFTDIITFKTTFNEDIKLFIYWHTIYILQLVSNMRRGSDEYKEEMRSMLVRFEFLKRSTGSEILVEDYIDSIILGEKITDEYNTAILIVDKINRLESKTLDFLDDLIATMPIRFKVSKNFKKEEGSIARKSVSSFLPIAELKVRERDIMVGYLYDFYNTYPKITVSSTENLMSDNLHTRSSVVANGYGGSFFIGDDEKEKSFNTKIDFLRTIWHISYLYKGDYLMFKDKDVTTRCNK